MENKKVRKVKLIIGIVLLSIYSILPFTSIGKRLIGYRYFNSIFDYWGYEWTIIFAIAVWELLIRGGLIERNKP